MSSAVARLAAGGQSAGSALLQQPRIRQQVVVVARLLSSPAAAPAGGRLRAASGGGIGSMLLFGSCALESPRPASRRAVAAATNDDEPTDDDAWPIKAAGILLPLVDDLKNELQGEVEGIRKAKISDHEQICYYRFHFHWFIEKLVNVKLKFEIIKEEQVTENSRQNWRKLKALAEAQVEVADVAMMILDVYCEPNDLLNDKKHAGMRKKLFEMKKKLYLDDHATDGQEEEHYKRNVRPEDTDVIIELLTAATEAVRKRRTDN